MTTKRLTLWLSLVAAGASFTTGKLEEDGRCSLLMLVPFTNEWIVPIRHEIPGDTPNVERYPKDVIGKMGYSYMVAAQLAIDQFNARSPAVVPELADLEDSCPVYFPEQVVVNSARKDKRAVRGIFESLPPPRPENTTVSERSSISMSEVASNGQLIMSPEQEPPIRIPNWCAVIGPMSHRAVVQSAAVTASYDIPQMIYGTDEQMATSQENPTSVGAVLTMKGKANAIYRYLVHRPGQVKRDYLAVLHSHFPHHRDLAQRLEDIATEGGGLTLVTREMPKESPRSPKTLVAENIKYIKSSGIQTILLVIGETPQLAEIAKELDNQLMLEPDSSYLYILLEEATSLDSVAEVFGPQPIDSALDRLLRGAVVISKTDRFAVEALDDPFLALWRRQDANFVEKMNEMAPIDEKTGKPLFQADSDFFQKERPSAFSSYVFDSVVAVGMSGRHVTKTGDQEAGKNPGTELPPASPDGGVADEKLDGGLHDDQQPPPPFTTEGGSVRRRLQQEAEMPPPPTSPGATDPSVPMQGGLQGGSPPPLPSDTGSVHTGDGTPDAPGGSASSGGPEGPPPQPGGPGGKPPPPPRSEFVNRIREVSFMGASGEVSFRGGDCFQCRNGNGVIVGAYNIRPRTETGEPYQAVLTSYSNDNSEKWTDVPGEEFIYRDNSTFAPATVRIVAEENFLSSWVRGLGLFLFASALLIAMAALVFVVYMRKDPTIRAAQPFFLCLLCVGSILMSVAIFTLSWDENSGWNNHQLSVACSLTPWFFFVGHLLMFSALATKLYRVDRVLRFSRQKVEILQVMGPLVFLLLAATVILSVWTALDPWVWVRKEIAAVPAETYGECYCESFARYFYSLTGLLLFCKIATAAMAWKTSDIPQDFSDTSSVFYAISTHIQAWFIGIPILVVLGNDSVDATYFGRVLLIWVFAVSGVSLVILPRILKALRLRHNPNLASERRNRVRISGLPGNVTPKSSSTSKSQRSVRFSKSSGALGSTASDPSSHQDASNSIVNDQDVAPLKSLYPGSTRSSGNSEKASKKVAEKSGCSPANEEHDEQVYAAHHEEPEQPAAHHEKLVQSSQQQEESDGTLAGPCLTPSTGDSGEASGNHNRTEHKCEDMVCKETDSV